MGVAVYAISYDPADVLAAFALKRGVTFPLLSDVGSVVIRRLGLLNDHLDQQHAYFGVETTDRHRGIPHPGMFLLDEDGVVQDKVFEQQHRTRLSAPAMVETLLRGPSTRPTTSALAESDGVRVAVSVNQDFYRPYQKLLLTVRITIPQGTHVYAEPSSDGLTGLNCVIEPVEGLDAGTLELPPSSTIDAAGEPLDGYEGDVAGRIWFAINKFQGDVTLHIGVRYQACTDFLCYPPAGLRIPLELRGVDLIRD